MSNRSADVLVKEARELLLEAAACDLTDLPDASLRDFVVATHEVQALATAVATKAMGRFDTH